MPRRTQCERAQTTSDIARGLPLHLSRRALLTAVGAVCLGPIVATAAPPLPAVRIGVVEGALIEDAEILRRCRALTGRDAALVRFSSWGSLRDHFTTPDGGEIDAAVLPLGSPDVGFATPALPCMGRPAALRSEG